MDQRGSGRCGSTADAGFADQMSAENVLAAQWPRGADDFRVLQADISPFWA